MKTRNVWLALIILLGVHGSARSDFIATATLTGDGESNSPGTGTGSVLFNSATDTLTIALTFTGLTSPTAIPTGVPGAAHIHFGTPRPPGGPILFPFVEPYANNFPLGVTSGTYVYDPDVGQPLARPGGRHQHVRRGGERDRGRTDLFQHPHSGFSRRGDRGSDHGHPGASQPDPLDAWPWRHTGHRPVQASARCLKPVASPRRKPGRSEYDEARRVHPCPVNDLIV